MKILLVSLEALRMYFGGSKSFFFILCKSFFFWSTKQSKSMLWLFEVLPLDQFWFEQYQMIFYQFADNNKKLNFHQKQMRIEPFKKQNIRIRKNARKTSCWRIVAKPKKGCVGWNSAATLVPFDKVYFSNTILHDHCIKNQKVPLVNTQCSLNGSNTLVRRPIQACKFTFCCLQGSLNLWLRNPAFESGKSQCYLKPVGLVEKCVLLFRLCSSDSGWNDEPIIVFRRLFRFWFFAHFGPSFVNLGSKQNKKYTPSNTVISN